MLRLIARRTVLRERARLISERGLRYDEPCSREDIEAHQVARFNEVWNRCLAEEPFYISWAQEHSLPSRISDVREIAGFPDLTKAVLVTRMAEVFRHGERTEAYSTGGSSGEPARFPKGENDANGLYANVFVSRRWWGVRPLDRYVHLWGHSHLFTNGVRGRVARVRRAMTDRFVNAIRLNAYDMSEAAMERYSQKVRGAKPIYIVGYTSALCRLARHAAARGHDLSNPGLRCVIATAETLSAADAALLAQAFAAPIVSEYGAAETGLIAVSRGSTFSMQVLWQSVIVRIDDDGDVFVTTLDHRAFPLVNYKIGDRAESRDAAEGNALTIDRVLGRTHDFVTLEAEEGGILTLSAILPVHVLKSDTRITAVQFRQLAEGRLEIYLTASEPLDRGAVEEVFRRRMLLHHPNIADGALSIRQVEEPILTRAGKQSLFV